jgi:hypothetical protein
MMEINAPPPTWPLLPLPSSCATCPNLLGIGINGELRFTLNGPGVSCIEEFTCETSFRGWKESLKKRVKKCITERRDSEDALWEGFGERGCGFRRYAC